MDKKSASLTMATDLTNAKRTKFSTPLALLLMILWAAK
ncbi:hypothetical protein AsAng_0009170 [Aureispira anguillae]|uniref:Uncharacterized protein n=1 Tax=Aureispira anguillae TaxID=2864201 RepID=A0A916DNZ4_9BACT|nr:hypothetical protein AsAng_0009170 [Aureispira anguillae]